MRLRPCIDIHDGLVKQIVGGSLTDKGARTNHVSDRDAAFFAGLYREKDLPGGHIILLNPVSDRDMYRADLDQAKKALQAYPGGMQIGGGITAETAGAFLDMGASHVIVTSYVFREGRIDFERLSRLERAVGRDRLVLDLSCRRRPDGTYVVVTDRWQKETDFRIGPEGLTLLSSRCCEFLIHAADAEGRRGGVEEDLVRLLGAWQQETGFPVTYAGGVHALSDLDRIRKASGGLMDVTVGSALSLFGGDLDLDDLVLACKKEP